MNYIEVKIKGFIIRMVDNDELLRPYHKDLAVCASLDFLSKLENLKNLIQYFIDGDFEAARKFVCYAEDITEKAYTARMVKFLLLNLSSLIAFSDSEGTNNHLNTFGPFISGVTGIQYTNNELLELLDAEGYKVTHI